MKNIKLLLLICALLGLCACEKKKYYIGVSQISNSDWRQKMNAEILRESRLYENLEVKILSADNDRGRQDSNILELLNDGIDLLILTPLDSQLISAVDKVHEKRIPIILVDRKLGSQDYTAFVGVDNVEIGREAASYLSNEILTGNLIELAGTKESSSTLERHEGFINSLVNYPQIKLLSTVYADWEEETAKEKMDSLFEVYANIDGVYCHNDRMARGVWASSVLKGRPLKIVGIDALPGKDKGIDMVNRGMIDATFIHPTVGDVIVQLAMRILEGKPFQKEIIPNTSIVNKYNARIMTIQNKAIEEADHKIELLDNRVKSIRQYNVMQKRFLVLLTIVFLLVIALVALLYKAYKKSKSNAMLLDYKNSQLLKLSNELEVATNEKLSFFTNVSHEFRTPLTLIAGPVEQLEKSDLSSQQLELVDIIRRNTLILFQLINKILDLRKWENGKTEFKVSEFSLQEQLNEWVAAFVPLAHEKKIKIEVNIQENDSLVLSADKEKVMSICFNLLSNALKYNDPCGKIMIEAGNTMLGENTPAIFIRISDTGKGIPEEMQDKIFTDYFRVHHNDVGTGLGLALVKAYVELHQGNITLNSQLGKGTVFTVVLPKVSAVNLHSQSWNGEDKICSKDVDVHKEANAGISIYDDVYEGVKISENKYQVLVVDDNADMCRFIKTVLEDKYRVVCASNGQFGLEKALRYLPDVIICDIMMPVVDGFELLQKIKSSSRLRHIPVIMLSACALDNDIVHGFKLGAASYLIKPFSKEVLLSRVQNLIDAHSNLKDFYTDSSIIGKEENSSSLLSSEDKDFLDKLYKVINDELGNPDFNVEDLSNTMGLSRIQLYRKIKLLTNYTPADLLKHIRLVRAKYLLENSDKNVTEIAFITGFSSQSYFTKCYKKYFDKNPTDCRTEKRR